MNASKPRHLSVVTDDFVPTPAPAAPTTPPCPSCGHALTAAYDDTNDSWWECGGCGRDVEDRDLPDNNRGETRR